jgi:hypothetical protein
MVAHSMGELPVLLLNGPLARNAQQILPGGMAMRWRCDLTRQRTAWFFYAQLLLKFYAESSQQPRHDCRKTS